MTLGPTFAHYEHSLITCVKSFITFVLTLAHYEHSLITCVKSFITLGRDCSRSLRTFINYARKKFYNKGSCLLSLITNIRKLRA